jgi:tripartite-type tricarboxylate transporter receptor subunit TctC
MRPWNWLAAVAVAAVLSPLSAAAQTYPSRPITLVVPFAAGGAFDTVARIIGSRMAELLGQPIIVENATGAGGIVGVRRVIASEPDGHTVLLGTTGTHAYNQHIYKTKRYDALTDFTPVTLFSEQPMVLMVKKAIASNNLQEFAALLKKEGSKMTYGSAGAGSTTHLACTLLNARIGVSNVQHIPYRGAGPAANDLIGGQIDYLCSNLGGAAPIIVGKQVKALALLSAERTPIMPDLATAKEQGIKDYDVTTWTAIFLPKGAPKAIVDKLREVTQGAMETPAIKQRMLDVGVTGVAPERQSPEYLQKFVAEEIARWEEPIKSAGLQVD